MTYNFAIQPGDGQRHPLTAALLSVVPGLGQLYNGDKRKGILFLDVAVINFLLLWIILSTQQLAQSLRGMPAAFHIKPNEALVQTIEQAHFGSPGSMMLMLMMAAFALFAARDAYDRAAFFKRKQIYPGFILDLSEATSGSYLAHFAVMISFAVLAMFFVIPHARVSQLVEIEFVPPMTETKVDPHVKTLSTRASEDGQRDLRKPISHDENSVKTDHQMQASKPAESPMSKPTVQNEAADSSQRFVPHPVRVAMAPPNPLNIMAPPSVPKVAAPVNPQTMPIAQPVPLNLPKPFAPALPSLNPFAHPTVASSSAPVTPTGFLPSAPKLTASSGSQMMAPTVPVIGTTSGGPPVPGATKTGTNNSNQAVVSGPAPMSNGVHSTTGPTELAPVGTGSPKDHGTSTNTGPDPSRGSRSAMGPAGDGFVVTPNLVSRSGPSDSSFNDGHSKTGKPSLPTTAGPDFGPYMAELQRRIKQHWFPPKQGRTQRVVVMFTIHTDGSMTDLILDQGSGDARNDNAALQAVRDAMPLRELPKGAPPSVDIQFTFDYNVFNGSRTF